MINDPEKEVNYRYSAGNKSRKTGFADENTDTTE